MNKSGVKKAALLFSILLFPSLLYILLSTGKHNFISRPYYGPKELGENGDTIYYEVPNRSFVNCGGEVLNLSDLKGKILVIGFFRGEEKPLESRINGQMLSLQDRFREKNDVNFISVFAGQGDSSLCRLERQFNVIPRLWKVVRVKNNDLENFVSEELFVSQDSLPLESQFVLLDKKQRIRGYADASQYKKVKDMIDDIKILKAEEFIPRKQY